MEIKWQNVKKNKFVTFVVKNNNFVTWFWLDAFHLWMWQLFCKKNFPLSLATFVKPKE
jgi:hypothetical protein